MLIGSSGDYHLFDESWQSVKYDHFQHRPRDHISPDKKPPTDDPGLYSLNYVKMTVKEHGEHLFISTYHPSFHPFLPEYYEQCPLFVKIDRATGAWEKMYGRFSPLYQKYKTIGQFSFFIFEMDDAGHFYVCFEIDTRIYLYDQEFINTRIVREQLQSEFPAGTRRAQDPVTPQLTEVQRQSAYSVLFPSDASLYAKCGAVKRQGEGSDPG